MLAALLGIVLLSKTSCTATYVCFNVPNNGNISIDYLADNPTYQRIVVSVDGVLYDSGLYNAKSQTNVPLYGPNDVVYATVNLSVKIGTCVRSGKATVCPRTVTLLSGSLSDQPISQ